MVVSYWRLLICSWFMAPMFSSLLWSKNLGNHSFTRTTSSLFSLCFSPHPNGADSFGVKHFSCFYFCVYLVSGCQNILPTFFNTSEWLHGIFFIPKRWFRELLISKECAWGNRSYNCWLSHILSAYLGSAEKS